MSPHDGELTFLGSVLGKLPVDIHLGKLMVLGYVFGILEETIIISMFNEVLDVVYENYSVNE